MEHFGQIVERVVRRDGYSISELARLTNVNRRSVYNWFKQRRLKPEIISRISLALDYDFSNEFPEMASIKELKAKKGNLMPENTLPPPGDRENENWKDLYIILLENYTELLKSNIQRLTDKDKQIDGHHDGSANANRA